MGDSTADRTPETDSEARTWSLLCHLSPLLGIVFSAGVLSFIGPLVIWLVKKDQFAYVDDQGKEAINFQIAVFIVTLVCVAVTVVSCGAAFPVLFLPPVLQVVFAILSALAANRGEYYRYPFNIRIVK